jgi:integrase
MLSNENGVDDYEEDLADGNVRLFKRNGIFQARIYKGERRYIYRSLKTRKLEDARRSATKFYYEIEFKKQEQLPLQQRSFGDVLKEYVRLREKDYEQSTKGKANTSHKQTTSIHMLRQIKRVSKFWLEYCGKVAVNKVDNAKLADYIAWRKDYYHRLPADKIPRNAKINPTDSTLVWETTLAKTVLKFAQERGYRGITQLPTWRYKVSKRIVRPTFTVPEYRQLYVGMRRWLREAEHAEYRYTRELLRDYVLILANSGMRVGEANNLRESDVQPFVDENGSENYMFKVTGKTGARVVIPRVTSVRFVRRVLARNEQRRLEEAEQERNVRSPKRKQDNKDNWFFAMYDGNKVITLIDQFQTMLKSINMLQNNRGEQYTLYSLRHFYAVNALRRRIPIFNVARNMGTSVQIIEQYYGKDATTLALAGDLGQ